MTAATRKIVLAGGGHAHALVLRQWGRQAPSGVQLTLVSPQPRTPYSGMLPGLIAGHYPFEDIHIDLEALCRRAGARLVLSAVTAVDTDKRRISLLNGQALDYDLLSINTGSMPDQSVPGVAEHAVPVKPIAEFWQRWQDLYRELRDAQSSRKIAVVGGGAGSVEIILAMARALDKTAGGRQQHEFHLVFQTDAMLPGYPARVVKAAASGCRRFGVVLHARFRVTALHDTILAGEGGRTLSADHVFWCTQAAAPDWPALSGIACENGFIRVNRYLQSVSHGHIFAAGDIAHLVPNPCPKAGVHAVRQAPVLYQNLNRWIKGQPLRRYRAQDTYLSLLSLGGKTAAGCRGCLAIDGHWVWQWKDFIDRRFMGQFRQ